MRDYEEQIKHLEELKDGWYEKGALAPTPLAIAQYRKFLENLWPTPSLHGGIQFEARLDGWEISVEFHADGTVLAFNFRNDN